AAESHPTAQASPHSERLIVWRCCGPSGSWSPPLTKQDATQLDGAWAGALRPAVVGVAVAGLDLELAGAATVFSGAVSVGATLLIRGGFAGLALVTADAVTAKAGFATTLSTDFRRGPGDATCAGGGVAGTSLSAMSRPNNAAR